MKTISQLFLLFALAIFTVPVVAQSTLNSPNADAVETRTPGTPIFVHYASSISETSATLHATSDVAATFDWYRFDAGTTGYDSTPMKTDTGLESTITGLGSGGYKVEVTKTPTDIDTLYAWIIMDYLEIGRIEPVSTCDALFLAVYHSAKIIYDYYDLSVSPEEKISLFTNPKVSWTTNPDNIYDGLEFDALWKNPITSVNSTINTTVISSPAPLATATYTATIKNSFGNISTPVTTPEIPVKAVYAVMKAEEQAKDGSWVEATTLEGSALYKLRFDHSESRNADTYTWIAYDNYDNIQTRDRVLWTYTTNNATDKVSVKYSYMGEELDGYIPGRFRDSLIVYNSQTGCRDSVDLKSILGEDSSDPVITVEASRFDPESLPNVFTPNGDGINDIFKFVTGNEPVSMKTMNFRVFDRAGKELYHYSGRISGWQGWNGKIRGTGSECSVGVYYYEISGTGWDNVPYSGKPYRGFFHLFKD